MSDTSATRCDFGAARPQMRIVIFHMDQLGDLLFSLPALWALRQRYPEARIVSVTRPSLAELLENVDWVDKVLRREKRWKEKLRLISVLRRERFDVAVCFSQAREPVLLSWVAGTPRRFGFTGAHFQNLLTETVTLAGPPSLSANLSLVERLGCVTTKKDYIGLLGVSEKQRESARGLLHAAGGDETKRIVVLAAGASKRQAIKQWTEEGFAEVADRLSDTMQVALVGVEPAEGIARKVSRHVVDMTGKTNLSQLIGLLSLATLFVGVDSGVTHVAAALNVPVVALFGPTNPQITGPCGEKHQIVRNGWWCSPCHLKKCPYEHECLDRIDPDMVWQAIEATGVL